MKSGLCLRGVRRPDRLKPEFTGGVGVSSMVKAAKGYGGEPDFKNEDGVFIFRLILNIP